MATINSMMSSSLSSASYTKKASGTSASGTSTSLSKQIASKEKEIEEMTANTELDSETRTAKLKTLNEELKELNDSYTNSKVAAATSNSSAALSAIQSLSTSSAGSSFDGSIESAIFGSAANSTASITSLFGAGATMANMRTLNHARQTISNESRTLASEIELDRARGVNTTDKQTKLSNLTENLTILDKNLAGNIDNALTAETDISSKLVDVQKLLHDGEEETDATATDSAADTTTASTTGTTLDTKA